MFLLGAVFYFWTAGSTLPLGLNGYEADPYNRLADAFLHFHLSVGAAPAGLTHLREPYNPIENATYRSYAQDSVLYRGRFYITWGPAPVVVLLVPMHLLGFEPSPSLTTALYASVGLGFALMTLRAIVRQIGDVRLWVSLLAALTLVFASAIPFILRRPAVYEEAISGGFCFAMAGVWLAVSVLFHGRASLSRLALASLCFGLAVGSRPTLLTAALLLVPLYLTQRARHPRGRLLLALAGPLCICLLLLLAYNQARFGNPLEVGSHYQLTSENPRHAPYGSIAYVPAGAWFYLIAPPRPLILFPFLQLAPAAISYPLGLPVHYKQLESVGGLLAMAPILIFLVALPWIWRRRPTTLGPLGPALAVLAAAGLLSLVFLAYEFFEATERYEVDFAALLLFGALAGWLGLASTARGWRRRLVQFGGGALAVWSCCTGLAVSFTGYYNLLAATQPATWEKLENVTAPLSKAIASVIGHPVLAQVDGQWTSAGYTSFGAGTITVPLAASEPAYLTIVSPNTGESTLLARAELGAAPVGAGTPGLSIGPAHSSIRAGGTERVYLLPSGNSLIRLPVQLHSGLNRLSLASVTVVTNGAVSKSRRGPPLTLVGLSLSSSFLPARG